MNTAAIVAASEFNDDAFKKLQNEGAFDYIMAVDGGYAHLQKIEVRPDIVIGDFDSLGEEPFGIRACKFPVDKDDSDLQLAMRRLQIQEAERVFVFGALGGRLDHLLANLRVCAREAKRAKEIVLVGAKETAYILTGGCAWERPAGEIDAGKTLSIMQIEGPVQGLFVRGLKWEGDDLDITGKPSLCLSNVTTDAPILIGIDAGKIAIIVNEEV